MNKRILDNSILIVEDQAVVALDLQLSVKSLGFTKVKIAHSGEEAILEARSYSPDLIIMDIMLGDGINGYEAANIVKSDGINNILFLSGLPDVEIISKIIMNNPNSLILKPHDIDELRDKIYLSFEKESKGARI